jgi:hypothetical protein
MRRTLLMHSVTVINTGLYPMVMGRNHNESAPLPTTRSCQTADHWLSGVGAGTWFDDGIFITESTASEAEVAVVAESFTREGTAVCGVDGGAKLALFPVRTCNAPDTSVRKRLPFVTVSF